MTQEQPMATPGSDKPICSETRRTQGLATWSDSDDTVDYPVLFAEAPTGRVCRLADLPLGALEDHEEKQGPR